MKRILPQLNENIKIKVFETKSQKARFENLLKSRDYNQFFISYSME